MASYRQVSRLKSSVTLGVDSLIEVFERGLRKDIESNGNIYKEVLMGPVEICELLQLAAGQSQNVIPSYLIPDSGLCRLTLSLSQRLIELLPALLVAREKCGLDITLSVYINTIITSLGPLEASIPLLKPNDSIVVNTHFSQRCLRDMFDIPNGLIIVKPPIPELCRDARHAIEPSCLARSSNLRISCFSRISPEKGIHELIKALRHLPIEWTLHIYGFSESHSIYEAYLIRLCQRLGLDNRIYFQKQVNDKDKRLEALLLADVVVNMSTSFEETMGKVILEALSWGKPVVANYWNGFADLLPGNELITTYWSSYDWYHVKANDISQAIVRAYSTPSGRAERLYEDFLCMREEDGKMAEYGENARVIPKHIKPDWKLLNDWISHPRAMAMHHSPKLLRRYAAKIGGYFAPRTVVDRAEKINISDPLLHPRAIQVYCQNKQVSPLPYLRSWMRHGKDSPYAVIAESLIFELEAHL